MRMPPAFTGKDNIHAIIETPKSSRNKFTYDKHTGMFMLKKCLPAGLSFPLDFGFIPNTKADDGDPMDVLVFMEDPVFPGCIIECKSDKYSPYKSSLPLEILPDFMLKWKNLLK